MIWKRGERENPSTAPTGGQSVERSTISGHNLQVGGDVQGPIIMGDLTIQRCVAETTEQHTAADDSEALAATVRRYRLPNRTARPAIMADHPGVALLVETLCAPEAQQVLVVHRRAGAGKSNVWLWMPSTSSSDRSRSRKPRRRNRPIAGIPCAPVE